MKRPLRLLIAEDDEEDAFLLVRSLAQADFDPVFARVETSAAMNTALGRESWDLVISDHSMPTLSPFQVLEQIQQKGLDIPVVIVSGTIEPPAAVAAMKAGAADFIMKDDLTRLVPAIERELKEAEHRRARREAERRAIAAEQLESVRATADRLAHDFNDLLAMIRACCEQLNRGLGPEDPRRIEISQIEQVTECATLLVGQLLELGRPPSKPN